MERKHPQEKSRAEIPGVPSWKKRWLALWPLLIPLAVLLPGMAQFPYPASGSPYSDLVVTHYPNAWFLRSALQRFGAIPLWNPMILSGYPFFANPLAGLWYPPGWLALLFPLPFGFNFSIMAHLLVGGLGMYRLLSDRGYSHRAALIGALAFEGMPKLFAHYGAGHLTLIYALVWTPWLLWAAEKTTPPAANGEPDWIKQGRAYGRCAVYYALLVLADVRWAAFAGLLWAAYALYTHFRGAGKETRGGSLNRALGGGSAVLIPALWATLISAVLLLPLGQYAGLSTRALMEAQDIQALSLPAGRALGLVFPDFGGYHEWIVYPGVVVFVLAIAALLLRPRTGEVRFWFVVAMLSFLLAMGGQFGLADLWAKVPVLSWLRIPARALFISGLAWAFLAAAGVEALLGEVAETAQRRLNITLAGLTGFALLLAFGIWAMTGSLPMSFAWGGGLMFLSARWIGGRLSGRITPTNWYVLLAAVALFDLLGFNSLAFITRSQQEVFSEKAALSRYLEGQSGLWRVYSPSYSLPQQVAAHAGLELADGVDPLQLVQYVQFMEAASGVPYTRYSVTLPSLENGEPAKANQEAKPDVAALGRLNVRYLAAEFPVENERLKLIDRFGESYLYENLAVWPRVWLQSGQAGEVIGNRPVEIIAWEPNRIELAAEGPARLVLSEVAYPGWQVKVDGQPGTLVVEEGLFRAVDLPPGDHRVSFDLRPSVFYVGVLASALGLVPWIILAILDRRQSRAQQAGSQAQQ